MERGRDEEGSRGIQTFNWAQLPGLNPEMLRSRSGNLASWCGATGRLRTHPGVRRSGRSCSTAKPGYVVVDDFPRFRVVARGWVYRSGKALPHGLGTRARPLIRDDRYTRRRGEGEGADEVVPIPSIGPALLVREVAERRFEVWNSATRAWEPVDIERLQRQTGPRQSQERVDSLKARLEFRSSALDEFRELCVQARLDGRFPVLVIEGSQSVLDYGRYVPLALGLMATSAASAHATLVPIGPTALRPPELREAAQAVDSGLALFSRYAWTEAAVAEQLAALNDLPGIVTIVGGPSVPRHGPRTHRFLLDHPRLDVAVLGEGELTMRELAARFVEAGGDRQRFLAELRKRPVAGAAVRDGERMILGPQRHRIDHLDSLVSPYLSGLFRRAPGGRWDEAIIESNRGCPYGCAFCDWGAATESRIRKFDLQRVLDEIEWCAVAQIDAITMADANFGILHRDVEIVDHVVTLKETFGYPKIFRSCQAKNTTKYTRRIIGALVDAGLMAYGNISLQTRDESVLAAVNRRNISNDKYDRVANDLADHGLPLVCDLIPNLPGATLASFADDLRYCFDNGVRPRCSTLKLLPNSPMGDEGYVAEHEIQIGRHALVTSTRSFGEGDFLAMTRLAAAFDAAASIGLLRHAMFVLQHELQVPVDEQLLALDRALIADEDGRFELLRIVMWAATEVGVLPLGLDELTSQYFDAVNEGLENPVTVENELLTFVELVQRSVLASPGVCPDREVDLEADYGTWWQDALNGSAQSLMAYPPSTLHVRDVEQLGLVEFRPNPIDEGLFGFELNSVIRRNVPVRTKDSQQ